MKALALQSSSQVSPAKKPKTTPGPVIVSPYFNQPVSTIDHPVIQRKCACGGGCPTCQEGSPHPIQTKLSVNAPGDQYEQEADRVADQVLVKPAHPEVSCIPLHIQRYSGQANGQTEAAPASVDQTLAGSGRPLDPALRQDMEQRFGHDFSRVRVHSDVAAEQSARDVNAHAYTVGHDIVFGARFTPETHEGRRLLAHELTHVVQQRQGPGVGGQTGTLVAQRQPKAKNIETKGKAPSKQIDQPEPSPTRTVNDPFHFLSVDLEILGRLYASSDVEALLNTPLATGARDIALIKENFTVAWIQGEGRIEIQAYIKGVIGDYSESERIAFLNVIDSMHPSKYDSSRKAWLRDQVNLGFPLTHEQRLELRRITGDRISMAYTDFSSAAAANAASIKAAVTAQATIFSVVVDVFMGLAAPGLAKGIAALVDKLPSNSTNIAYRLALQGLDQRRTEQLFAAATKVAKETIRANAQPLFGETDTDIFIKTLKSAFRKGTDKVNLDLPNLTDEELGVVAATYDPNVSDEAHYIPIIQDLVSRFHEQVQPIGPVYDSQIVWVQVGSAEYLVRVYQRKGVARIAGLIFATFIDTDLKDAAIAQDRRFRPEGIPMRPSNKILHFPDTIPTNAVRR